MRLVDIEAEVFADCVCRDKCDRQTYCFAKEMQTVDAVHVVRCRECKHHHDCGTRFCDALGMDCPDDSEFFCSYGERKEGADNG